MSLNRSLLSQITADLEKKKKPSKPKAKNYTVPAATEYAVGPMFEGGGETERLQKIAAAEKAKQLPFSLKNFAKSTSAIGEKMRFSAEDNLFDDYLNPLVYLGEAASGLGQVPYDIQRGQYTAAGKKVLDPVIAGAGEKIGEMALSRFMPDIIKNGYDHLKRKLGESAEAAIYHRKDSRTIERLKKAHEKAAEYYKLPAVRQKMEAMGIMPDMIELPSLNISRKGHPLGSHFEPARNNVHIDLAQLRNEPDLNFTPRSVYDHEMGHWLQKEYGASNSRRNVMNKVLNNPMGISSQDLSTLHQLEGSPLSEATNLDKELVDIAKDIYRPYSEVPGKNFDYFNFVRENQGPNEAMPHLREMRRAMVNKGYLKDILSQATPEQVADFMRTNPKDRISSFMSPEHDAFKLADIMNRMPAVAPVVGAGVAASQMANKKKRGGSTYSGGLWYQDGGTSAYVDSVLNANKHLNWVKRLYDKNGKSIMLPGQTDPSTHFMESGDGRVYPTVVQMPDGSLQYLGDKAYNYADSTKTYIQFPDDKAAQWFGKNYKKGTNVLKSNEYGGPWYDEGGEYTGSSIVDYLQTKGLPGTKQFRKQLAKEMNIEGYNYSAEKNLELLSRLRDQDEALSAYEPQFTPIAPEEMVRMEQERGVYYPSVEDTQQDIPAPAPVVQPKSKPAPRAVVKQPVKSAPVSNQWRIPMAAPYSPYTGMYDPRVSNERIAAMVAKMPVARAAAPAARPKAKFIPKPVASETRSEVTETPVRSNYVPNVITGPSVDPGVLADGMQSLVDGVQGIWEKGMNWYNRNQALTNDKLKERKSSINTGPTVQGAVQNAGPIYMTGDTIRDNHGRYHLPEVMDLNEMRFGTRNRGEYAPIDTEAGSITAFNPFKPAKDYFATSKDPANATYLGFDAEGKAKVGQRKDFENSNYRITKTFSNKIVDFNRNPDGSIVKVPSNPKASKETLSPSVKVLDDNGKVIDGKMSLLLPRKGNQEESFDLVTGGRYIMQTPDGKMEMVSGSLKNIEDRFKKLKANNPYVNVITLDNGSYSRGIRTYNKKLTAKDLKRYDNQNTEGGNFAYLLPNSPKTRYDAQFRNFESTAQKRLQAMFPGKKVEVKFQNDGVYDERGSRDIESQAAILKKGYSQAPISMHNFDAARDYQLFVDGKPLDANKQKNVYKNVLWKAADQVGMYHLDDWDAVHIGLVKEGEKTGFNELNAKYPEIFNSRNFKRSKAFLEKHKNEPAYKEAYALVNNIKPFTPKAKKEYGGSWLDKYN